MSSTMLLHICLAAVGTTVVICSTSDALPLEVKVTNTFEPWINNENDDGKQEAINSMPVSLGKLLNYPESYTDTNGGDNSAHFPIVISFRNLDGVLEDGLVKYETARPNRLERFYKHSSRSERTGEKIMFPNEEVDNAYHEKASLVADKDDLGIENQLRGNDQGHMRLSTPEETLISSNRTTSKTREPQIYSLDSLSQIVRHLLFRFPVSQVYDSSPIQLAPRRRDFNIGYEYNPMVNSGIAPESSSSLELDVRDQSLYNGPKFRSTGSGDCAEGYKKTRNGLCQKPSRRLLTGSR